MNIPEYCCETCHFMMDEAEMLIHLAANPAHSIVLSEDIA